MTAAEEDRARRKAAWEAQQARRLYEEMVLKKPKENLVQIGNAKPAEEPEKVPVYAWRCSSAGLGGWEGVLRRPHYGQVRT